MDTLRSVPAGAGAGDIARLAIFARGSARTGAVGFANIVGLRRALRDAITRILARIGGDRVQLIRLRGIDLLGRALSAAAAEQSHPDEEADAGRGTLTWLHGIPLLRRCECEERANRNLVRAMIGSVDHRFSKGGE